MANNDNKIVFVTEDGKEETLYILFTYHSEDYNKEYVFVYEKENEENIMVFSYVNDRLFEVEDDEEFKELEEVLEAYLEEKEGK